MTKAELIRKIAKRGGVPDQEARVFFELLLKKISLQIKPGESVKLRNIGYFQLRTGKLRSKASGDNSAGNIHSELMVFYPLTSDQQETQENFIFNVPQVESTPYNFLDSFFSLSFGKPVIPLKNASASEFFIAPTGVELRRQTENKVEKIIQEIEIVDVKGKIDEELFVDQDDSTDQFEFDWENIENAIEQQNISDEIANEPDNLSWDFGSELDKEIEEESILDLSPDDNLVKDYEELEGTNLNWDFGEASESTYSFEEEPKEIEAPLATPPVLDIQPDKLNTQKDFHRVKSFTSEINIPDADLSWDFGSEDILKQTITEEINEQGFAEVKSKQPRFPFITDIASYSEEEQKLIDETVIQEPEETELLDEEDKLQNYNKYETTPLEEVTIEDEDITLQEQPIEDKIPDEILAQLEAPPSKTDRSIGYTGKKGMGFYVISAVIILFTVGYFFYTRYLSPRINTNKKILVVSAKTAPTSAIIERSFDVPVTYPYNNSIELNKPYDAIKIENSAVKENQAPETTSPVQNKVETNQTPVQQKQVQVKETSIVQPPGGSKKLAAKRITPLISQQSNDRYFVQVSAWPNQKTADLEAARFRNQGYETYIEKAYVEDHAWYRLKVGPFHTLDEAKSFSSKNK
jgi:cell division septation protein DedD